ncbi:MAG: hypothetical protein INQ03_17615 [Candidatus Heimdallarchaeota archaeon]|nr:hypothetical protein [Candidatus Heimdallarchaeota archaeon]
MSEVYQCPDGIPPDALLGALLTAFRAVADDVTKKQNSAEKMVLSGITYHLKYFANFSVVIVADDDDTPTRLLNKVGWGFLKDYGTILDKWTGRLNEFDPFRPKVDRIVKSMSKVDETNSIKPTKKLDIVKVFKLPKDMKNVAKSIIFFQDATVEEVSEHSGEDKETVTEKLKKLQDEGFIGTYQKDNETYYFCG